ncbi:MAG: HAD family hydrolase [Candidatus Aminicenantes bacterium]|nr:HAD family hydrolase [Candidatus Aminicenantes bacterium]MDH5705751.1 HAD family hydrolase [Candidatus Aminicenantes bacterium]
MILKGAIFDMDGTVVDVSYDWVKIKAELMTEGKPILLYLQSLEEPDRSQKWKVLERYEHKATQKAKLKPGMHEFLDFLSARRIKKGLVTNNSRQNAAFLLRKFDLAFDCVISRESGLWKPSGAPILAALQELKLKKDECCVIGDSHFDIHAAAEAGIPHIFILSADKARFDGMEAEVFSSVEELQSRIEDLLKKEKR